MGEVTKTLLTHTIAIPPYVFQETNPGDLMCAYDEQGNCFGLTACREDAQSLTVFGDDLTTTEKDGFVEGEEMFFKIINRESNEEYGLAVEFDSSLPDFDGTFRTNGLSAMKGASANTLSVNDFSNSFISIYPNPAQNVLHVKAGFENRIQLEILNIHGQVVQSEEFSGGKTLIDISTLPTGLYVLQVNDGIQKITKKLVKE